MGKTLQNTISPDKSTLYSFSGSDISIFVLPPSDIMYSKTIEENIINYVERNSSDQYYNPAYSDNINNLFDNNNYVEAKTNISTQKTTIIPNFSNALIQVNNIQTFSYSIYRDKEAVRVLGQVEPIGFTRGQITLAGTIIFTVTFGKILYELFEYAKEDGFVKYPNLQRIDQLPPLDFMLVFNNEYGAMSRMVIYGVEFMNEGQVMSVQDLMTENSVNYMARYFSPMTTVNAPFEESVSSRSIQSISDEAYRDTYEYMKDFRGLFI